MTLRDEYEALLSIVHKTVAENNTSGELKITENSRGCVS